MPSDNYDRWLDYDRDQERRLQRLPKCACCGEPIQSEYGYRMQVAQLYCQRCFDAWMEDIREEIA